MSNRITITAKVNGETVTRDVEPRQSLVDFLREELELTGSHVGCAIGGETISLEDVAAARPRVRSSAPGEHATGTAHLGQR